MFACDSRNSNISLHSPLSRLSAVSRSPVFSPRGQPESCGLFISPGTILSLLFLSWELESPPCTCRPKGGQQGMEAEGAQSRGTPGRDEHRGKMCQRAFGKEGDQDDKLGSPRWVPEGGRRGRKRGRISRAVRTLQGEAEGTGEVWGLERDRGHYGPARRKHSSFCEEGDNIGRWGRGCS